jgi:hypothetical protein
VAVWVTLADLRGDVSIPTGVADDAKLTAALNAAVAWVESARADLAPAFAAGTVPASVKLGTIRLAARWYFRRLQSGQVTSDFGSVSELPYTDPDIERLLGVGKFGRSVIA